MVRLPSVAIDCLSCSVLPFFFFSSFFADDQAGLNSQELINFIDAGHNVFIAGGPQVSESIQQVAVDMGVTFDEESKIAMDHIKFNSSSVQDHRIIVADDILESEYIFDQDMEVSLCSARFSRKTWEHALFSQKVLAEKWLADQDRVV